MRGIKASITAGLVLLLTAPVANARITSEPYSASLHRSGKSTVLVVDDVPTGERVRVAREPHNAIGSIVLDDRGRLAWVVTANRHSVLQVRDARRRVRTIDKAGAKAIRNVKLAGGVLHWSRLGRAKTVRVADVSCQTPGRGKFATVASQGDLVVTSRFVSTDPDDETTFWACDRRDGRSRYMATAAHGDGYGVDIEGLELSGDNASFTESGWDKYGDESVTSVVMNVPSGFKLSTAIPQSAG